MSTKQNFTMTLTPQRRQAWQDAADAAIPGKQRNVASWLVPLVDKAAELQKAGRDPLRILIREAEKVGGA